MNWIIFILGVTLINWYLFVTLTEVIKVFNAIMIKKELKFSLGAQIGGITLGVTLVTYALHSGL